MLRQQADGSTAISRLNDAQPVSFRRHDGLSGRLQNPHVDAEPPSFEQRRVGSDQLRLQRLGEYDVRRVVDREVLA